MPFDIQAARKAGATDQQILEHLKQNVPDFDFDGAINSGASIDDIAQHVSRGRPTQPSPKETTFGQRLSSGLADIGSNMLKGSREVAEMNRNPEGVGVWEALGKSAVNLGNYLGAVPAVGMATLGAAFPETRKKVYKTLAEAAQGVSNIPLMAYQGNERDTVENPTIGEVYRYGRKKYPTLMKEAGGAITTLGAGLGLGIGGRAAPKIVSSAEKAYLGGINLAETAVSETGKKIRTAGEKALISGMKPKDVTAKLAGRNVEEGAKKIAEDVSKYNLQSTTGGFSGIIKKANDRIFTNEQNVNKAIETVQAINPDASIDIDKSFLELMDNVAKGKENLFFGNEDKAQSILDNIHKALELRGLTGVQPISKIPEIKRTISDGMKLFKKGKFGIAEEPILKEAGEIAYLKLKKDLESVIPEIKDYNNATHDLINVKKAASEAVKRIGNKDQISLTDWILVAGGPAALGQFGTGAAIGAGVPGAILIGKKAFGSGRGASALIGAGKAIESAATKPVTLGSLGRTLKSERGSIGVENPQVHTESFKKWFGDWDKNPEQASKVVDESGKPLVVYHGTNSNFNVVNPKKGAQGVFWFTSDPATIKSGMSGAQGTKNIKELFADIKKPAGWTEYNKYSIDELERMGYDGVILPNKKGGFDGFVLNGNQVKSATKNTGSFSSATNDIRGSTALKMLGGTAAVSGGTLAGLGAYQAGKNRKKNK